MPQTHPSRLFLPEDAAPRRGGAFVLYWLQATMRAEQNPALNYAVERANELGLPVLAYQGLRQDYPWANDRLHTFVLESVVDLYQAFARRGIRYAFYLDQRDLGPHRARYGLPGEPAPAAGVAPPPPSPNPLVQLAERAALVVTDFAPTFLGPRQLRGLRRRTRTPVVAVDGATVVPLRCHEREYATARALRPVLMAALGEHLRLPGDVEPRHQAPALELPFAPTEPSAASIPALVAGCQVDHDVAPSPTLRGGPRAARERLRAFLRGGLQRYAQERGDPNADGTSRLSAYLHFGNIAIQEVLLAAREAAEGEHYDKFLDEALVWRELAHNFVFHDPRHRTLQAVPGWAREELRAHQGDPRPALPGLMRLEAARSGEPLWDACQRALLREGELHNHLRMLWGKAVLGWTSTPEEALAVLEHLNNKYALDGRDANSYGGILWCFGKFDRPFYRRAIYGTVRYQSLKTQHKRFDVARYLRRHA